ncbi:MAG: hypothetical protein COS98_01380 [Parcubacteria group bacterium CG07_land_8_20_14_0_80_35_11]|nr:MAG: hypothetical protein COS98_01380 [Parcubacteria group bacterium CG07_land_8_20_14_0_80_35_11]
MEFFYCHKTFLVLLAIISFVNPVRKDLYPILSKNKGEVEIFLILHSKRELSNGVKNGNNFRRPA